MDYRVEDYHYFANQYKVLLLSINSYMIRQAIIERTIKILNELPEEKAKEISDFADFLIKKYEEQILLKGIAHLAANSKTFEFLEDEEDLYTEADIKEPYNG